MMITKETTDLNTLDFHSGQTILIDKPISWSSFKVVAQLRRITGEKKIGHAGTLDPLATGLLVLCTGKKTKQMTTFMDLNKVYEGTILLGKTSPSLDLEFDATDVPIPDDVDEKKILKARENFIGEILQVPPMFSAKKFKGKPLYKLARKGKEIAREPRKVNVAEFEIIKINMPEIHFRINCSKGTYIRSIADDFGKALGTAGILSSLRRTEIGEYKVANALTVSEIEQRFSA